MPKRRQKAKDDAMETIQATSMSKLLFKLSKKDKVNPPGQPSRAAAVGVALISPLRDLNDKSMVASGAFLKDALPRARKKQRCAAILRFVTTTFRLASTRYASLEQDAHCKITYDVLAEKRCNNQSRDPC